MTALAAGAADSSTFCAEAVGASTWLGGRKSHDQDHAGIRDNLTLNVLMLVSPIDAIRTWQASG